MRLVERRYMVPEGLEAQVDCYVQEAITRHLGQVRDEAVAQAVEAAAATTLADGAAAPLDPPEPPGEDIPEEHGAG